jgi:hypothetical protein
MITYPQCLVSSNKAIYSYEVNVVNTLTLSKGGAKTVYPSTPLPTVNVRIIN